MADFTSRLVLDTSDVTKKVAQTGKQLNKLGAVSIEIDADASGALKSAGKVEGALEGVQEAAQINLEIKGADKAEGVLSKFKKQLSGAGKAAVGGDIGGALASLPIPQLAAAGAAIGAIGGVLHSATEKAKEFAEAQKQVSVQTGLSGEELEKLSAAAKNAYVRGVGESAAEALKIVGSLKQTLGSQIPTDQLDKAAARAQQVGKALGVETPELVAKFAPLIKQYGVDFDTALNIVNAAAQNGVADVGGYLDAINEFTPAAVAAGLSAEQFAAALSQAGQAGVKDLAKVGDGLKVLNVAISTGDLEAKLGTFSGDVAKRLQEVAKLGKEGAITGSEVLSQSLDEIDKQFKSGKISGALRDQLIQTFGGSVAEDIGSDAYARIFSKENLDPAKIKAAAQAAGKQIDDNLAKQDPLESLAKQADVFLQSFGKPIIEALDKIGQAFAKAFGDGEDPAGGLAAIGEAIGEFLVGNTDAIIIAVDAIGAAVKGVKALADLLGIGSDGVEEAGKKSDAAAKTQLANNDKLIADAAVLAKSGKLNAAEVEKLAAKYGITAEEAKKTVAASAEVGEKVKAAAIEVNALSQRFTAAIAAAGGGVTANRQALAQIDLDIQAARRSGDKETLRTLQSRRKELVGEALDAVKEQRRLDKSIDAVTFGTDPAALKARSAALLQLATDARTAAELVTAQQIDETHRRVSAISAIEAAARKETLENQIRGIDSNTVGGRQQIADIRKQIIASEKKFTEDQRVLRGQQQADLLAQLIESENQRRGAVEASLNLTLQSAQRQIAAANLAPAKIAEAVDAQTEAIRVATDAQVRALVEATPEFRKAAEAIQHSLTEGVIPDAAAAKARLEAVRDNIIGAFREQAGEGGGELGSQIRQLFATAEEQAADAARGIRESAKSATNALVSSDILRAINEQVLALENQRDLLLTNTALTEAMRKEIEGRFAKAIRQVTTGELQGMHETLDALKTAAANIVISITPDNAAEAKASIEAVYDALRRGAITYQEALGQLAALEAAQRNFGDRLVEGLNQSFTQLANAQSNLTATRLAEIQNFYDEIERIKQDATKSEDQRIAETAALQEKAAKRQEDAITSVAAEGILQFGALLTSSEDASEAMKNIASSLVQSLVSIYSPAIIALFQSIIPPPFGAIAGALAVAGIKSTLAAAIASFAEGGYTGDGGVNQPAGIVHKGEFVLPQRVVKKHRQAIEHLYNDRPVESYRSLAASLGAAGITPPAPIEADISALRGELMAIRHQLQSMEALHKTAKELTVYADAGTTIKGMRKQALRSIKG